MISFRASRSVFLIANVKFSSAWFRITREIKHSVVAHLFHSIHSFKWKFCEFMAQLTRNGWGAKSSFLSWSYNFRWARASLLFFFVFSLNICRILCWMVVFFKIWFVLAWFFHSSFKCDLISTQFKRFSIIASFELHWIHKSIYNNAVDMFSHWK